MSFTIFSVHISYHIVFNIFIYDIILYIGSILHPLPCGNSCSHWSWTHTASCQKKWELLLSWAQALGPGSPPGLAPPWLGWILFCGDLQEIPSQTHPVAGFGFQCLSTSFTPQTECGFSVDNKEVQLQNSGITQGTNGAEL